MRRFRPLLLIIARSCAAFRLPLLFVLALGMAFGSGAETTSASSGGLLQAAAAPAGGDPGADLVPLRKRFVTFGEDQLLGAGSAPGKAIRAEQALVLNVFDDRPLPIVRDGLIEREDGTRIWSGHVVGQNDSVVTLAIKEGRVAGSVTTGDQLYRIRHAAEGVHVVEQTDLAGMPPYAEPIPVDTSGGGLLAQPGSGADARSGATTDGLDAVADDGSTIDMLVVWTPAARTAQGGTAAMEALIDLAVVETNQAYAASGIAPRVNLVHKEEISYTESGNFSTDLSRLAGTSDGYMDGVHALRDAYAADQVTLINNSSQYCGIAYLMTNVSNGFASSAFSVVFRNCATGYYSFGHELGHNQGSHHDRANAGGGGAYPYSYGYQQPSNSFRTIMAYNCNGGCPRVQRFSNPDVSYNGFPTGIDHDADPVNSADNARSIDATALTVSNFRESTPVLPPDAPSGLSATAASESSISLSWTDNANNETGFTLQRSPDGATGWTTVATLGADTVNHSDSGLEASTTYHYRLRAYNGGGESAWSSTAAATTDDPPPFVDQTPNGELLVEGTVTGGYADTATDDGVAQSVRERESGGKPQNRHSYLEHKWTIPVQPGNAVTLFAQAWAPASGDGDQFVLAWSADDSSYTDMLTVSSTSDGGPYQSYALPASTSGTIYVRVRDTDRSEGNRALDTVYIDHLYVRSESATGTPPAAPSGLSASAVSSGRIDLGWADDSSDEYGFQIERSPDGSNWSALHTTGADATSYADTTVASNSTYHYRLRAYNGAGSSAWSGSASATTPVGSNISLSLSGSKDKGNHIIDLSWSGASGGNVDILRDGSPLITTANDGAYTDATGNKGGRTYTYQVCEEGTSTCSDAVDITF